MYNYIYTYEAYFMFGDISLRLGEGYSVIMGLLVALAAIAAFALVLFSAIANKKGRIFGCIAAVFAPLGILAAHWSVTNYAQLDFSFMGRLKATSTVSMSDAITKLSEMLVEEFTEKILSTPEYYAFLLWTVVAGFCAIITIVYTIILLKSDKGNGLAVGALILVILKFIFMSPIQSITAFAGYIKLDLVDLFGPVANYIQLGWETAYYAATLLPLLLIAIQALMCLLGKKKKATAPVVDAPAEAVAEAPAENE
jgi:hypothetical protein